MKTQMKLALVLGSVSLLAGCATGKYPILTTPAVSMTDHSFESGYRAKPAGEVNSTYCTGEDPISTKKGDNHIGMMDEVVLKAQKESGARYIANATFFAQGKCIVLEGTAMK